MEKQPMSVSMPNVYEERKNSFLLPNEEDFSKILANQQYFEKFDDPFGHYHLNTMHHGHHEHHDVRRRANAKKSVDDPSCVESAVTVLRARAPSVKNLFVLKDVSDIDRYARIMFPTSFLVFNAFYWVYYTLKANAAEP